LAWFSPRLPDRTGIAAYTAELLPHLERDWHIDSYDERNAFDFVWRARRHPYDLVVYQLGNARWHDWMWGYLAAYPGLAVLHDARLHHARARLLLVAHRDEDYRREFRYNHPDVRPDAAEYAVAAMGGPIQYLWPMRRVVLRTARRVAVHAALVADELRREEPSTPIDTIRMGVPGIGASADARGRVRAAFGIPPTAIVFTAFGKMTAEKRLAQMLDALEVLAAEGLDVHLLLVGEDGESFASRFHITSHVHTAGYVPESEIGAHLLASDICLCLRWPTALETSASWLRCLAAGRATIVTDLAHTADVPTNVARRVGLLDEVPSLIAAMRELATHESTRTAVAEAGRAWWTANHTVEAMASDYRRVVASALASPAPMPSDLPSHFLEDFSGNARSIANRYGVSVDILDSQS